MREHTVFPDTNLFLQCRWLTDLPWEKLFEFDALQILISPTVLSELDRLKHDGNPRRAQRARDANSLFGQMLENTSESFSFERDGKEVIVRFAQHLPAARTTPEILDRTRPDDGLLEEVWSYSQGNSPATLVSGDTGLELKARRLSVAFKRIPDTWLLAPEADEREKQLRAKQKRIDELESAQPDLSVEIRDGVQALERLKLTVPFYEPLTSEELDVLQAQVRARCPRVTQFAKVPTLDNDGELRFRFPATIPLELLGVSKDEIDDYEVEYAKWDSDVRKHFERLALQLNAKHRWTSIAIEIDNLGATSAEHLLVELRSHDGLLLCVAEPGDDPPQIYGMTQKFCDSPTIPKPPEAPQPLSAFQKAQESFLSPRYLDALNDSLRLPSLAQYVNTAPLMRDRHALRVREDDSKALAEWSIDCEEFRHGRGPQRIQCWLIVPTTASAVTSRLFLRATAKNIAAPLERYLPIELTLQPRSTYKLAQKWTLADSKVDDKVEDPPDDEDDFHAEA